jgi:enamine deaminase RidA (YjgF/YER057c/UK114 family)
MDGTIARRLSELGLVLPPQPLPVANYLPFVREGRLVQIAGVAPTENGRYAVVGKLGRRLTLEDGRRAARLCALNILATLRAACGGDLDRVRRVMMVRGFVNAAEDFEDVPLVINGASDLIVEGFRTGDRAARPHLHRLRHLAEPGRRRDRRSRDDRRFGPLTSAMNSNENTLEHRTQKWTPLLGSIRCSPFASSASFGAENRGPLSARCAHRTQKWTPLLGSIRCSFS